MSDEENTVHHGTRLGRIRRILGGRPEGSEKQHQHPVMRKKIADLEKQIVELRQDLQEQRLLGLRVAELSDLVTGLIGAAAVGPEEFQRALAEYTNDF